MPDTPAFRILVRVHHRNPFLAQGIEAALSQQSDMAVVAGDGTGMPDHGIPRVVVADHAAGLRLAVGRGAASAPRQPEKILIVAADDRAQDVRAALAAGVAGYLHMDCTVQDLAAGIRQLARGACYLGPATAQRIADGAGRDGLTARQREVLVLVARGASNKGIARGLDISTGTVKSHMKAILEKLGARSRTQAMRVALERGLVEMGSSAPAEPFAGR